MHQEFKDMIFILAILCALMVSFTAYIASTMEGNRREVHTLISAHLN